jgi:hypothetical protein
MLKAALLALMALTIAVGAHARPVRGVPSLIDPCPITWGLDNDGCAGRKQYTLGNTEPTFIRPNFALYATQSVNGLTHRSILPTLALLWNQAGATYRIGPGNFFHPWVTSANHPSGCSYNSAGGSGVSSAGATAPGAPYIRCNGASPSIAGWDFTDGGTTCIGIEIGGTASGTLTIQDNIFGAYGPSGVSPCQGPAGVGFANGWFIKVVSPTTITVENYWNNSFNGNPPGCTNCLTGSMIGAISDSDTYVASGAVQVNSYYNVYLNNQGRVWNTSAASITSEYDYIEGVNLDVQDSGIHGEIDLPNVPSGTAHAGLAIKLLLKFDTILYPDTEQVSDVDTGCPDTCASGGNSTALVYFSSGNEYPQITAEIDYTYLITNAIYQSANQGTLIAGQYYATVSAAGWEISYGYFVSVTGNYVFIDPNGAYACTLNGGGGDAGPGLTPTYNHVIDLYDGSTLTTWDGGSRCNGARLGNDVNP